MLIDSSTVQSRRSTSSGPLVCRLGTGDVSALRELRLRVAEQWAVPMGGTLEDERSILPARFESLLSQEGKNALFGAFDGGHLIGAAGITAASERVSAAHTAILWGVVVCPGRRRQNIGTRVVEACLSHAHGSGFVRVNLVVYLSNAAAQAMYEALGFSAYGVQPQALRIGDAYHDALLMSKGC
jgi:ribosomal protein S18 acetylase RimI-like enzyme